MIHMIFHVLLCNVLCRLKFCNDLDGDERAGCFTLFFFLMSCDCCYYYVSLPHGAVCSV